MASKLLLIPLCIATLIALLLLFEQGRRLVRHCWDVLLNGKSPLRWFAGLAAGIVPPVTWTLAFKCARNLPPEWRPAINVDLLPRIEARLLSVSGTLFFACLLVPLALLVRTRSRTMQSRRLYPVLILLFPLWLKALNKLALGVEWTPSQDVIAWIFYGVLHFASPFIAGWWIWGFGPPGAAIVFGLTLGVQNLSGLFTHIVFPNAAPWYYDVYPVETIPDYDFPGNPAGLIRVDAALGTHLYKAAFKKSPVVFGALPSLHAATSMCFSFFVARYGGNWGIATMIVYSSAMFWSTMYLHHHFAIDLVVGSLYSLVAFSLASHFLLRNLDAKHEREMTTRGVDRLFGRSMRSTSKNVNSYERLPPSARVAAQLEQEELTSSRASTSRSSSTDSEITAKIIGFGLGSKVPSDSVIEMEEGRKSGVLSATPIPAASSAAAAAAA